MARAAKKAPELVSAVELAAEQGCCVTTICKRVKSGLLTGPNRKGLFDRALALREFTEHPLRTNANKPGPKGGPKKLVAIGAGGKEKNPDYRWRLARARREEIHVRRMTREDVNLRATVGSLERLHHEWRDLLLAMPRSEAETIADVAADHGAPGVLRELDRVARGLCVRLAACAAALADEDAGAKETPEP